MPESVRDRISDFAFHALANAAGTLIAALVLFLAAAAFGVISDVSLAALAAAAAGVLLTLAGARSAYKYSAGKDERIRAQTEKMLHDYHEVLTPEEGLAIRAYADAGSQATDMEWLAYAEAANSALGRLIKRDQENRKQGDEDDA